jgi:hypothetical protein
LTRRSGGHGCGWTSAINKPLEVRRVCRNQYCNLIAREGDDFLVLAFPARRFVGGISQQAMNVPNADVGATQSQNQIVQ